MSCIYAPQEVADEKDSSKWKVETKLLACIDAAHGVFDVNAVAWCPRPGMQDVFATAGDDGHVKVWRFAV